jgi:hypothetical protein
MYTPPEHIIIVSSIGTGMVAFGRSYFSLGLVSASEAQIVAVLAIAVLAAFSRLTLVLPLP